MGYELQFFDDLIRDHFVSRGRAEQLPAEKARKTEDMIRAQVMGARNRILHYALECATAHQTELYIRNNQMAITLAMDRLDEVVHLDVHDIYTIRNDQSLLDLAKLIYRGLWELMFLLKTYFTRHLDTGMELPRITRRIEAGEMLENARWIRRELKRQGVPPELIAMLVKPLRGFCRPVLGEAASWQQLLYLKGLTAALARMLERPGKRKAASFIAILESRDFNLPAFCEYLIEAYRQQLDEEDDATARRNLISRFLREAESRYPITGDRLMPDSPPLKQRIIAWLVEELEQLRGESHPVQGAQHLQEPPIKVPASLTVPQMAHLLRLMVETGIYTDISPLNAIRFQAANFSTPREKQLSAESMRQKYYPPDSATSASVRELLLKMVHHSKGM